MPSFLRTHPTIGVLAGQPFYSARLSRYMGVVCRGISATAKQEGCNLLFACGIDSAGAGYAFRSAWPAADAENDFVPVGPWNTDALIVLRSGMTPTRSAYVQELISSGFPVIFIGPASQGRAITVDNVQGIHDALAHLAGHGHRQIAFIAGFASLDSDSSERLGAYRSGMARLGLPVDPAWVAYGEHNWFGGQRAMRELLEREPAFSAILASNDESARGALDWLKKVGLRVPEDMALIGFDDQVEARGTRPTLTSVHQPMFELGQQALLQALATLRGDAPPVSLVRVAPRLVLRESCGCQPHASTSQPTLAAVVGNETIYFSKHRVEVLCARLLAAWQVSTQQDAPQPFLHSLDEILAEVEAAEDDVHAWQAALTFLGQGPLSAEQNHWLHMARSVVSQSVRRQHNHYILMQWVDDDVARITARLLAAKDEAQVVQILESELPLAPSLPSVCISRVQIALTETAADVDGTSTPLSRILTDGQSPGLRFDPHLFPPPDLGYHEPFSLALLPLVFRDAMTLPGYVIMEMENLSPYAAFIAQHLAVALNSAHLYREATEGRKLAEEANRIKSRFLSMVSHELRTPLSAILGVSELAIHSGTPETHLADLERIYANARHLSSLVNDVLDLSSSDVGQMKFFPDRMDFQQALKPVLPLAEHLTRSKGLAWRLALPTGPLMVHGDSTRLRQVTLNLLSNAAKFTARGHIALTVERRGSTLSVTVSDSGVGIPLAEQEHIFDEFRQSERTASRGYGGAGLGLAICKRIVEAHGGRIGVHSSGEEGAGSSFFFELPLLAETLPSAAEVGQARVLILHEIAGPSNATVARYLEGEGYTVLECTLEGNPDWLNQAVLAAPGALVLNMQPHSTQTWEIFRRIKDQPVTRDLPILLYSLAREQGRGDLLELDYLSKPIDAQALWQTLQRQGVTVRPEGVRTILVVDDDASIREMHCRMVQQNAPDYRVLSAPDGRTAFEILRETPVDLILLDLMMPEMDGFTLLEQLRDSNGLNRNVSVIVLTAQVLNETEMARLNRGVARVLEKGMFTIPETLAHVGAALARNQKLGGEPQRLVRKAMVYIHDRYADPLTRKDIARYTSVSEDYLTHCFQQELGISPVEYITRYRMQQARQLLSRSTMRIADVAQAVGIGDNAYFSRLFRQETGLSPRAYRDSQREYN